MDGIFEQRGERDKEREVYTNGARTRGGRGGEGDATRLINRHADNHSGFMVTTDYQVVQGGIFHIRDVTLFQWGNTCSARYKLHECAYTGRHVCCLRILPSSSLSLFLSLSRDDSTCAYTHTHIHTHTHTHTHTYTWLGNQDARELARRRGVQVLPLSPPFSSVPLTRPDTRVSVHRSSRSHRGLPFSQNHSHVRQSARARARGYKCGRPLFRETDPLTDHRRHRTPTRYPGSRD